ncbi:MAG TPA: MBL fold metallo-hydrolase [Steroidobacteraceae bacterium]|nr:MBL fold metallo-hydrolase [Steroidobacteraceae bacterium]
MNATTSDELVYLAPKVKLEPLVSRWYAWSHLISPLQLAMNLAYRYVPLLQSFIMNPSVHLAASREPKMFGGPFVNLEASAVSELKQLLESTNRHWAAALKFAADFRDFDKHLQERASGYSLNELYTRLPEPLRGLVELAYDTCNHPQIRIMEEILDREDVVASEQEILLTTVADRERLFFMSTPRLNAPDNFSLKVPFRDARIDTLAKSRAHPCRFGDLTEIFSISEGDVQRFREFFTTEAPRNGRAECLGGAVRVRYFGHACVLVQTDEVSILIDPMVAFESGADGRFTFNDLPNFIDYVVLSHNHQDHSCPEMLLQLRHRVGQVLVPRNNSGNICDPSMKLMLKALGFAKVTALDPLDSVPVPGGEIISLPFAGEHVDLDIQSKQTVLVSLHGRSLLFLVDSDGWDVGLYRRVMKIVNRPIDALFLGMECHGAPLTWLYGPLLTKRISRKDDESRRLSGADCERAWGILQEIRAPRCYVYAMGQEPWLRFIMGLEYTEDSIQLVEAKKFVARCQESGIEAKLLYVTHEFTLPRESDSRSQRHVA